MVNLVVNVVKVATSRLKTKCEPVSISNISRKSRPQLKRTFNFWSDGVMGRCCTLMYGAAIIPKRLKMKCFRLLWSRFRGLALDRAAPRDKCASSSTPPAPGTRAVGPNSGAPNATASLKSRVWILSKHQRLQHSEGLSICTTTEPSALGGSRDAAECRKVASSRRLLEELSYLLRPWLTHDQRRLWSWRSCRKSSPRRLNSPPRPGLEVNVSRAHQRDFARIEHPK